MSYTSADQQSQPELFPLLSHSSPTHHGYATMQPPKLSLNMLLVRTSPSTRPLPPFTTNEYAIVDIESTQGSPSSIASFNSFTSTTIVSPQCEHCRTNNLIHDPEASYRRSTERCVAGETSMAILEFLIVLQMRLLAFLVPLLLVFVLGVYFLPFIERLAAVPCTNVDTLK
jgi:hypothetical protein